MQNLSKVFFTDRLIINFIKKPKRGVKHSNFFIKVDLVNTEFFYTKKLNEYFKKEFVFDETGADYPQHQEILTQKNYYNCLADRTNSWFFSQNPATVEEYDISIVDELVEHQVEKKMKSFSNLKSDRHSKASIVKFKKNSLTFWFQLMSFLEFYTGHRVCLQYKIANDLKAEVALFASFFEWTIVSKDRISKTTKLTSEGILMAYGFITADTEMIARGLHLFFQRINYWYAVRVIDKLVLLTTTYWPVLASRYNMTALQFVITGKWGRALDARPQTKRIYLGKVNPDIKKYRQVQTYTQIVHKSGSVGCFLSIFDSKPSLNM